MEIDRGIQSILNGEAVLFLGAGFSLGATNLQGHKFMNADQTRKHFASESGLPEDASLEDAADTYIEELGEDALIAELQQCFTTGDVCSYHKTIAKLPWKRVYTTNYDDVYETATKIENKSCRSVSINDNVYKIPMKQRICVHADSKSKCNR